MTVNEVRSILAAFGGAHPEVTRVELFGSVARGENTPESDVDLVVTFAPGSLPCGMAGFTFLNDLEEELAVRVGRPVNLIEESAVQNARRIGNYSLPRALARDSRLVYEAEPTAN